VYLSKAFCSSNLPKQQTTSLNSIPYAWTSSCLGDFRDSFGMFLDLHVKHGFKEILEGLTLFSNKDGSLLPKAAARMNDLDVIMFWRTVSLKKLFSK